MANFAVAASQETIEKANQVMEMYAQEGDKKEDVLLRILSIAENESVRGTHPALEKSLRSMDGTINTLVKQINGIVAGQDNEIQVLKEKLENAIEEKRTAIETANAQMSDAKARKKEAEESILRAKADAETEIARIKAEASSIQKDAMLLAQSANSEKDQALRERDDARTIAAEKATSNDLLMRQMAEMEEESAEYKGLQKAYADLKAELKTAEEKAREDARKAEEALKDLQRSIEEERKTAERDLKEAKERAENEKELAVQKAVIEKEREMNEQLRQADIENARLSLMIEQLQEQIKTSLTEITR